MHPSLNLLQTARLAFCGLFALAAAGSATAQTGVGLVLSSAATHTFPETTVGTTTTFTVTLTNSVAAAQTAYFGGLAAPFSLAASAPISIPGSGTTTLTLQFSPTATGTFTDTLTVVGNIFGSASLILTGTGIEVDLDYASTALTFPATALGATSTATVAVHNVGDGTALLSALVFSHPAFSLVAESSTATINEGESGTLTFSFAPTAAGTYSETVTIASNDPNEPSVTLTLSATAVSEVSGEVCNTTWTLANSPYTLVGNVTVPAGCTLTIEPGVVVEGFNRQIRVEGALYSNGNPSAHVELQDLLLYAHHADTVSTNYTHLTGDGSIETLYYPDTTFFPSIPQGFGQGPDDIYYQGMEEFQVGENNLFSCWDAGNNNSYQVGQNNGAYGCKGFHVDASLSHSGTKSFKFSSFIYSGFYDLVEHIEIQETGMHELSFGYKIEKGDRDSYIRAVYCINNGPWIEFFRSPQSDYSNTRVNVAKSEALELNAGDQVRIRFENTLTNYNNSCYDELVSYVDDIRVKQIKGQKVVILTTNGAWSPNEDFTWSHSSYYSSTSYTSDYLTFNSTSYSSINFQPLVAPYSGYYYFDFDEYIPGEYQGSPMVRVKVGASDYITIHQRNNNGSCTSYVTGDIQVWKSRQASLGYVEAGTTILVELSALVWSGYSSTSIGTRYSNLSIYTNPTFETSHQDVMNGAGGSSTCIAVSSDLHTDNLVARQLFIEGESATLMESDFSELQMSNGTSIVIESTEVDSMSLASDNLNILNCSIGNAYLNGDSLEIQSSTFQGNLSVKSNLNSQIIQTTIDGKADFSGNGQASVSYSQFINSPEIGLTSSSPLHLEHVIIRGAVGDGLSTGSETEIVYSTIAQNGGLGWRASGSSNYLNNSIIWTLPGIGAFATSGIANITGSHNLIPFASNGAWYGGMVYAPPMFADAELHLQPWSPAVDAAMPWHTDAHMPYGLGGLRADMGAYGGPGNAGWGGQAAPSGAAVLAAVLDSPQDQGGHVGLTFGASAFDEAWVPENVTHYAVWRHFDPSGTAIADVEDGNWELLGSMPSLGLNGYAFSAATLGNTNAYGEFESCYFVAAHTADPGTYWVSNVVCGESVDNLAPEEPVVNGLVLPSGGVEVQWEAPTDEDYAYTLISSDQGFSATVGSDTLVVDVAALGGGVYTVRHVDVNGNESAPGVWVAGASSGVDIIPLRAGWNLISTDRVPETATPAAFFGGLEPGNLQYVTGFNDGVQYFNPSGLSFLNTLSAVAPGYGYWVRVAAADTLYVAGSALPAGYLPTLDAGWNLVGYTAAAPQAPADFFSDFVADGTLEYVTGFDAGATFYDPDGLPFLNTLSQLRNGFGYWVRLTSGTNGLATDGSPAYDLVNGRSALGAFAGDRVEVVTAEGEVVAHLPILQGGYLMTAAVFGDDPATDRVEGVAPGTVLGFRFQGRVAAETVIAGGEMGLREVELTFPDGAEGPLGAGVYPNPTDGPVRFRADLGAGVVSWTVADLAGRTVADGVSGAHAGGAWESGFDASGLAPGLYTWTVRVDGVPAATLPWLRAE